MATVYFEILSDWNFWGNAPEIGVERKAYIETLNHYLEMKEVIALAGVRRGGKSTILKQLIFNLHKKKKVPYENTLFINFEDPRFKEDIDAVELFDLFKEYKEKLKPKGKVYIFLDEVQKVTRWEQFVRTLYDLHDLKKDLKFFVTGSNSTVFASKLSTSLTGRMIILPVYPLSFKEFINFNYRNKEKLKLFQEYLKFGGFPEVVLENNLFTKKSLLVSYYNLVLENDVILRHDIKNKKKVFKLARYALSNNGNLISSYNLEKSLNLPSDTVSRYLDFFEEAYLISQMPMFSYSVRKQIYNQDKIYSVDTGLANIAGFNFSQNLGRLLENLVFNELKAQKEEIYYFKSKNGQEVDFAVFKNNKIDKLINVTSTVDDNEVLERELNSLAEGGKEFPEAEQILLTLHNQSGQKDKRIHSLIDFLLEK